MKGNVVKYVLVVSLLLNLSLLGTAGYTYYRSYGASSAGLRGIGPGQFRCGTHTDHFFQQLSLKPAQVKLFQEKALTFHRALHMKAREVERLRSSLVVLMRMDNPDSSAIEDIIGEINACQKELQKMVVAHMLEFKSMLDKEQQKKFLDLVHGAMNQRGETVCP